MQILVEHKAVCNIKVKIKYIYNNQEHKNILLLYEVNTRKINRTYMCCILHYIICSHVKH